MVNEELTVVKVVAQPHDTKLLPTDSDGNQLGDGCIAPAAKPAVAQSPFGIRLVGEREDGFLLAREILGRNHSTLKTELEPARSLEQAPVRL